MTDAYKRATERKRQIEMATYDLCRKRGRCWCEDHGYVNEMRKICAELRASVEQAYNRVTASGAQ